MTTKRRSIPDPRNPTFPAVVKERLELIAGERGTPVKPLASTASTADIINKINELLELLQ